MAERAARLWTIALLLAELGVVVVWLPRARSSAATLAQCNRSRKGSCPVADTWSPPPGAAPCDDDDAAACALPSPGEPPDDLAFRIAWSRDRLRQWFFSCGAGACALVVALHLLWMVPAVCAPVALLRWLDRCALRALARSDEHDDAGGGGGGGGGSGGARRKALQPRFQPGDRAVGEASAPFGFRLRARSLSVEAAAPRV